jgi:hypothetical protein
MGLIQEGKERKLEQYDRIRGAFARNKREEADKEADDSQERNNTME